MTAISQMDEYLLLLAKQERMKECLDKIEDNQQNIKDYLSKVDNSDISIINTKYFKPDVPTEESNNFISRTEIEDDVLENELDKGKSKRVNTPTLPNFDHITNGNFLEIELNMEDSDLDSDWEELASRFNGLSFSKNNAGYYL